MKLYVAVLCYNVPDLTIDCLRSLATEIGERTDIQVGICENGSGGNAAERIQRAIDENGWGSWATQTVVYPNRGFCGGNNAIIEPVLKSDDPPEYILLLNADTIVLEKSLDHLVEFMDKNPKVGIAGSQFLSPTYEIQSSPFRFHGILTELDRGLSLGVVSKLISPWALCPPTPKEACPAEWLSGASMILRKTMIDQIGLLDEGLYTYFDDIDVCLRAHRAGWEVWYVPESKIIHLEGASTGVTGTEKRPPKRRPAYWFQARRRFFLKSYGKARTALADAAFLSGFAFWRLRRWLQRKPDSDPPHLLADSFRHSVFMSGFRITEVENPALKQAATTNLKPVEAK